MLLNCSLSHTHTRSVQGLTESVYIYIHITYSMYIYICMHMICGLRIKPNFLTCVILICIYIIYVHIIVHTHTSFANMLKRDVAKFLD